MSCAKRRRVAKLSAAMVGGLALGGLALAVPVAFAQSNPYSDPSVIVDLSVLEKFGPPPNLPGLLRQSGQGARGQPATKNDRAVSAPERLLPPPASAPQSHVTLPGAEGSEKTRTARPTPPRAKPAKPPRSVASQPKTAPAPAKVTVEKPKAPPPPPKVATPAKPTPPPSAARTAPQDETPKAAAVPQPPVSAPPPPKADAPKAEDAKPAKQKAETSTLPTITPPPPPMVTAPPVPVATAEPASQAKTITPPPAAPSEMAAPPKVPDGAADMAKAPSAPEEPSSQSVTVAVPAASGTEEAEKQVAARTPGPAPKVSADGKTINIAFPAGISELPGGVDAALGELAQRMKTDESLRLDILGYAAGEAEAASQARRLSLFRALAVRSHLMKQGILSTRMNVRALGNNAEADAPADRVEIVVQQ